MSKITHAGNLPAAWSSPSTVAERLDVCVKTVLRGIAAGDFGENIINVTKGNPGARPTYRIPDSGLAFYLERKLVNPHAEELRTRRGRRAA